MGWKNVRDHYRISHTVQIREEYIRSGDGFIVEECICIGSDYRYLVIGLDGEIKHPYGPPLLIAEDLVRNRQEMAADPATLRALVQSPDTFSTSIPVYTFKGGVILEKWCETLEPSNTQPEMPNITHDGFLMYEHRYSTDKAKVVEWAKRNSNKEIAYYLQLVHQLEKKLAAARTELAQHQANRSQLESQYPGNPASATGHSPSQGG